MCAIDVVIATLRRPEALSACLDGLAAQTRPYRKLVVVTRDDDDATRALLGARSDERLEVVVVHRPGLDVALRAGVAATTADVVAFIDDDAVAGPDWIARMMDMFSDPSVGAVGGRDRIPGADRPDADLVVGRWTRGGVRAVGNHHRGAGPTRDVDFLKGVNMAVRADVLTVGRGDGLRSRGAQPGWELVTGAAVRAAGLRVVYDPGLVVDHAPARRVGVARGEPDGPAVSDDVVHQIVARAIVARWRAVAAALYLLLMGSRATPGFGRTALAKITRDTDTAGLLTATARGVVSGLAMVARPRRRLVAAAELRADSRRPRPAVVVVGHGIDDSGGQERATAEIIRRTCGDVDYQVVAGTLAPDLVGAVDWHRVRMPPGPFLIRYVWFAVAAGVVVRRLRRRSVLVHTVGAVVPGPIDVCSIHYCWAEAEAQGARPAAAGRLRRCVQRLTASVALSAERRALRPGRVRFAAAVSERTAQAVRSHHEVPEVVVVPDGVDVDHFLPDPVARAGLRNEMGVADGTLVVLFVGGDWLAKGLDVLIGAFARFDDGDGPPAELWIAGRGDPAVAAALADEAGCSGRVRALGFRPDIQRVYAAADVLVHVSRYETFGMVVAEAAASGLPIITGRSVAPDVIVDALPGWLLVDGTVTSVSTALRRVAVDPADARTVGRALRESARLLSWDVAAAETLALYERCVRGVDP
ncbi:MAG: glycosyltransferase [Acidimicrobiales bacterium]